MPPGYVISADVISADVISADAAVRVLPADHVGDQGELAYASTVHGTQGDTVTAAHLVIGSQTGAASTYVGMTRGREPNTASWPPTSPMPGTNGLAHSDATARIDGQAVLTGLDAAALLVAVGRYIGWRHARARSDRATAGPAEQHSPRRGRPPPAHHSDACGGRPSVPAAAT